MHHKYSRRFIPLSERFWRYVVPGDPATCWLWTAAKDQRGYGVISAGGKRGRMLKAHRVAWELANGPISGDMEVCHRCDVPSCVNAAHLFLGTHADNMRDAARKGRARGKVSRGEDASWAKLTAAQVVAIRADRTHSQRQLARQYGVDQSTVGAILRGENWRSIG